jgi:hypothetical protein
MTTYPLSELATIYVATGDDAELGEVVGRGTLAECAEIVQGYGSQQRSAARIEMDELDLRFGPREIEELLLFLRDESAGLTNQEISAIPDPDR